MTEREDHELTIINWVHFSFFYSFQIVNDKDDNDKERVDDDDAFSNENNVLGIKFINNSWSTLIYDDQLLLIWSKVISILDWILEKKYLKTNHNHNITVMRSRDTENSLSFHGIHYIKVFYIEDSPQFTFWPVNDSSDVPTSLILYLIIS